MMLCIWALAAVCCSDDELGSSQTSVKSGDEVQFGLSLAGSARTVYGTEADGAFPILWKNGDKVQILSPQCLAGRNNAEYQVTVDGDKNYADALTKTGAAGVQWSSVDENINFYSVYPSGTYSIPNGEKTIQGLKINELQMLEAPVNNICKPKMTDCLMFAKTTVEKKTDEDVVLTYLPLATSIRLTLKSAPLSEAGSQEFRIQNVSLSAFNAKGENVNIVGEFGINLEDNSFSSWMTNGKDANNKDILKASNTVNAKISGAASTGYYVMPPGGTLTIPLFIAPQKGLNIQYWVVQVQTNVGTFTKKITESKSIEPGQVHKLTLPTLIKTDDTEWDVSNWMTHIPRNVYLSEVSIPGSWNSLNEDFQGTSPSIATQYAAGVRAFHLDCRWSTTKSLGFLELRYRVNDLNSSNMYLAVADGGDGIDVIDNVLSGSYGKVMERNTTKFAERLRSITRNVRQDEYMVVFCSFAQESYNDPSKSGMTWMKAISDVCAANDTIYNASNLDENTVVGDVLGKVIVVVNLENASDEKPAGSKCLFCHIPNELSSNYFPTSGFVSENLYTSSSSSSITMAVSQAQITSSKLENNVNVAIKDGVRGYYPSMDQRKTVVNNILDWSKSNYTNTTNYTHDKWIYLGLGGSMGSSANSKGDSGTEGTVTNTFVPLINERIAAMGKDGVPFYPVGIVYLNSTTTTAKETVKNILMLNNSYTLQHDSTKPAFPNTNLSAVDYDAYNTVGGNAFQTK